MNTYTRLFPENVLSRILIYLSRNLSMLVIFEKKKKILSNYLPNEIRTNRLEFPIAK